MDKRTQTVLLASGSVELYTPHEVLDPVRAFAPIGFDPCANPRALVGAARQVVLPEDGLLVPWPRGVLVWVNPPYGRHLVERAAKIAQEAQRGCEILVLVPARTDTAWWRALAAPLWCAWAGRIVFLEPEEQWRARVRKARKLSAAQAAALVPRRRVGTLVGNDGAPFPAALGYHGPRPEAFAAHFGRFGTIYRSAVPPPRRGVGRPRAPLPPLDSVRELLQQGASVRRLAAELQIPRYRAEEARRLVLGRPARVCKSADLQTALERTEAALAGLTPPRADASSPAAGGAA